MVFLRVRKHDKINMPVPKRHVFSKAPEDVVIGSAVHHHILSVGKSDVCRVPLTDRTSAYGLVPPDMIFIFQEPLEREFWDDAALVEEVRRTVLHELAHHFGITDEELERLGLD